ncbi:hypothetical protein EMCRGX_G003054 [Ephydatia muelleri]
MDASFLQGARQEYPTEPVSQNWTLVQTGLAICKGIPKQVQRESGHELVPVYQIWTLVQIGLARLKGSLRLLIRMGDNVQL